MSDEFPEWTAGDLRGFLDGVPEDTIVRVVTRRWDPVEEAIRGVAVSDDLYLDHEPRPDGDAIVYIVADGPRDSRQTVDLRRAWDAMWYRERP